MPFTSGSSFYFEITETDVNAAIRHLREQRPTLFNFGTESLVNDPDLLCEPITVHPAVASRGDPIVTRLDPLDVPTDTPTKMGMEFGFQFTQVDVDFHPTSRVSLPPELSPLNEQQFAFKLRICGGIGCPNEQFDPETSDAPYVPFDDLTCLTIDLWATGHFEGSVAGWSSDCGDEYYIIPRLDGIEIVDITPENLENGLECYMATIIRVYLLPQLETALRTLSLEIAGLCVSLSPTSRMIPHNPAIEDNRLKVYINIK